jgi:DNA polymerase-4
MSSRAVIHVDLDAFFVSVELKKKPELKNRPIIVGADGDPAKRGVVSSASYDARSLGVVSGMSLKRAYRLCPQAVFLPVDFEAYEKASEKFMSILRDYSPLIESFGLDEGFVEIGASKGEDPFPAAERIAKEIKGRIKDELGLTASVGIGPNKLLAKTACDLGKPDGFFVIHGKDIEAVLRDLPVQKIPGIGPKTEKRLKDLGVSTVGELSKLPLQYLQRNFGPNFGSILYEHSRGIDVSPVVPFHEPGSISREVTYEEDTGDPYIIKETLYGLTEDLTARLKGMGYKGKSVTIKVRYANFRTNTISTAFSEATDSLNDIWAAAIKLLESVEYTKMVRLVGIKVSKLEGKK